MKTKVIGLTAVWLIAISAIVTIGTGFEWTFNFWANSTGNATIPNQPFVQALTIKQVNLANYYFVNNSIAVERDDLDDIADLQPLLYYNNASNKDMVFFLNNTGSRGLNEVCEVYIKPSEGLKQRLTPDISQNFGRPSNATAYFMAVKYLRQEGECYFTLRTID